MTQLKSFVILAAGAAVVCARADPGTFALLSAEEATAWNTVGSAPKESAQQRDLGIPGVPNCHAIPSAAGSARDPQIRILAPALDKPLAAPLDIDLRFVPGGAAIRPDTFKVCYLGLLIVDLTKRVTDHVAVSAEGLHVTGADLPKGHHHLVMMIADQKGAIGSRDAVFDIR